MAAAEVPEPSRGNTIDDRHSTVPEPYYTEEECRLLCPICGGPEIHGQTYRNEQLYTKGAQPSMQVAACATFMGIQFGQPADQPTVVLEAFRLLRNSCLDLLHQPEANAEKVVIDIEINP